MREAKKELLYDPFKHLRTTTPPPPPFGPCPPSRCLSFSLQYSTPYSWRHKCARKELLDWYSDKQQVMSLKNTLLESSSQKARSPIFPCPYSHASSSQVQLNLDTRFLGNSNSPLIRTIGDSLGFTSYIYCKFNFENPKPRSQQCFVAPFLCISPVIPVSTLQQFSASNTSYNQKN